MRWGYTQTDVVHNGDETTVELSEVMPLEGTPYERLIAKNGHPLTDAEKRKEDEKFRKALRERQSESPSERKARIQKYENERSFLKDLPSAYDYKIIGEETVGGRAAWIISVTPRPDFHPMTMRGGMLKHIEGKLWIDKEELHWAKAEAHVIDTISIGWVVARIGPGAHITLDMTRVAPNHWMPEHINVNGTARVLMVHNKTLREEITFSQYRRADAPQVAAHETAPAAGAVAATAKVPAGSFR